jgi:acyl-CoA thioesterase I
VVRSLSVLFTVLLSLGAAAPALYPQVLNLGKRSGPVVVLGDSLSYGTGSRSGQGYVRLLQQWTGHRIVNRGVPGDTTAGALQRLQRDVLNLKPSLVLVQLGGNDHLRGVDPSRTFANLDSIVAGIQKDGGAVMLLGHQGWLPYSQSVAHYKRIAEARRTAFVPDILRGILDEPALRSDNIHPNDAGYQKMAAHILPELKWCLERVPQANTRRNAEKL